ncbi:MAG: hypothetical protein JWO70_4150 [Betaproteobacteria bacterium]|nr:hypothetical protein [Betaproteobacteria bacterium]
MADPFDLVLTLSLPAALEEEVLDHLLSHPEWVSGFTVSAGEGHGLDASLQTAMEKIRGRARRRLVTLLIADANLEPLLASLRAAFRSPEMAFWVTPLIQFGRFA